MLQSVSIKTFPSTQKQNQINQVLVNNQYNKEQSLQRNNNKKNSSSKKSVKFNANVEIFKVESWKNIIQMQLMKQNIQKKRMK